jgi:hypothetical protein
MGKQIFSVFLDGVTHAAISALALFFKETAFPIGPDSKPAMLIGKEVKCYLQLAAFFTMTLQLPLILALLTGK